MPKLAIGGSIPAITIAIVAGSLAAASPAAAQTAAPPPGSYLLSCSVSDVNPAEGILTAFCNDATDFDWQQINRDWSYLYCIGDIANHDGYLSCPIDYAKLQADMQAAKDKAMKDVADQQAKEKAAKDAAALADAKAAKTKQLVGSEAAFAGAGELVLGFQPGVAMRAKAIAEMKTAEFGMAAEAAQPTISFNDASKYFRKMLTLPNRAGVREASINRAYIMVRGVKPTLAEFATADAAMMAGKATYASIVLDLKGQMKGNPAQRKAMLDRVYMTALGIPARPGDIAYWAPRSEGYAELIRANRKWMYSPQGVNDRIETTRRALQARKALASDDAVKAALVKFAPSSAIYQEMVAQTKAGGTLKIGG